MQKRSDLLIDRRPQILYPTGPSSSISMDDEVRKKECYANTGDRNTSELSLKDTVVSVWAV